MNDPERTLGFRYKEMHLPLDVEIYVLGVVGENRCIGAPPGGAKGQRFLISVNSEEARAAELGTKSRLDARAWRCPSGRRRWFGLGSAALAGALRPRSTGPLRKNILQTEAGGDFFHFFPPI